MLAWDIIYPVHTPGSLLPETWHDNFEVEVDHAVPDSTCGLLLGFSWGSHLSVDTCPPILDDQARKPGRLVSQIQIEELPAMSTSTSTSTEGSSSKTVILVTGGTGLVGSAIRWVVENEPPNSRFGRKEDEEWVFLSSKDCDLRDFAATAKLFETYRPTYVIHLAALVGGLFANMSRKLTFLRDNLLINDAVLQNSHDFGVKKVVSCLSTCVFPDKVTYPLTEDKIHIGPPHPSNFGYAHGKRLVDVQNHAYYEQYGDHFTSVIPTNVFGPGDNYDLEQAHVIPSLIHRCYVAKRDGTPFTIAGTGKPLRQFIYSRDLAKLFIWVLREYEEIDPVILSGHENDEISIKDVGDAIVKAVGYEGEYTFDTSRADGQFRKPASNDKLMAAMGDTGGFQFTPFHQALKESVEWFEENYSKGARIGGSDQSS